MAFALSHVKCSKRPEVKKRVVAGCFILSKDQRPRVKGFLGALQTEKPLHISASFVLGLKDPFRTWNYREMSSFFGRSEGARFVETASA